MRRPDWHVTVFCDVHLERFPWIDCPGHTGVTGNDGAGGLAGKATTTSGWRLGSYEVLRSLRHYLQALGQGHTIDRLGERRLWKRQRFCCERTRQGHQLSIRPTPEMFQKQHRGNSTAYLQRRGGATSGRLHRDGVERIRAIPST